MRTTMTAVLCAALVPALAFAYGGYLGEVVAELEALGIPAGGEPAASAAADGDYLVPTRETTPAAEVKTAFAPCDENGTTLVITSSPAAATVTVDGRDAGATPLVLTGLAPGAHRLTVAGVADEVDLKPGGVTHVDITCAATQPAAGANYVDNSRTSYFKLIIDN